MLVFTFEDDEKEIMNYIISLASIGAKTVQVALQDWSGHAGNHAWPWRQSVERGSRDYNSCILCSVGIWCVTDGWKADPGIGSEGAAVRCGRISGIDFNMLYIKHFH